MKASLAALGTVLSVVLHGAIALSVIAIPKEKKREATAITVKESKKKDEKKKQEPPKRDEPPPPPKDRAAPSPQRAKTQAPAKPDAAPPPVAKAASGGDALPDLGFALGGPGGGGMAVPVGGGGGGGGDPAPKSTGKGPEPQARPKVDECSEPLVKAKPKRQVNPPYPEAARESGKEGVVKIEVQIGEDGRVRSARLVSGLGHGFDESALAAAKQWVFEPASRCGKVEGSSRTLSFRFQIGT